MTNEENVFPEDLENLMEEPEEKTSDEKITGETEEPEKTSESEKTEKSKEIATLNAQKKHWREKALGLEKELAKYKVKGGKEEGEKKGSKERAREEFEERVEFLLANRDVTEEEYQHLAAVALRDSGEITFDSLTEAKEKEADYLKFIRQKVENQKKTPGSTSSGAPPSFIKSPQEIAKMTKEEHMEYERKILEMERKSGGI